MSGLAAVLAGRTQPGVYRWHAAFDKAHVRHTVEHAGWRFGYVDGWTEGGKADFLAEIGTALEFPDHYGRNLDALNDCLRDVTGPAVLLWDGWATLAETDEHAFRAVLDIFDNHTERLSVLLRGEGPDPGLPSLD